MTEYGIKRLSDLVKYVSSNPHNHTFDFRLGSFGVRGFWSTSFHPIGFVCQMVQQSNPYLVSCWEGDQLIVRHRETGDQLDRYQILKFVFHMTESEVDHLFDSRSYVRGSRRDFIFRVRNYVHSWKERQSQRSNVVQMVG